MNKQSGIYQITNKANAKNYIGSTVNFAVRWSGHISYLKKGKHYSKELQSAFNEHGEDCFIFSVLEYCDESLLFQREQFYIDALKPEYNLSPTAGSQLGIKRTQETKRKMSIAKRGNTYALGHKHTQETRSKMSFAHTGKKLPQETKNKISNSLMGHNFTQETKEKLSLATRAFWARLKQTKGK